MQTRVRVISAPVLAHCMEHPARVQRWTVRELATYIGWSRAGLGHLISGQRDTLPANIAVRISEAVGVHPNVLFTPPLSTESDDRSQS